MPQHRITKPLPQVSLLLASFPFLLLILFFAYVLRARLYLGHWPSYNHPDPKELGWSIQHGLLQLGFIFFPVVAILAAGLAILGRADSREFPIWTIIATVIAASATLVVFGWIDPGGFMNWFWD